MVVVVVVVLIVLVLATVLAVVKISAQKKRSNEAEQWAAANGWQYAATDDALAAQLTGPAFSKGHGKRAIDVVTGPRGPAIALSADYQWATDTWLQDDSGSGSKMHYRHVAWMQLSSPRPVIMVTPRAMLGRLNQMMT